MFKYCYSGIVVQQSIVVPVLLYNKVLLFQYYCTTKCCCSSIVVQQSIVVQVTEEASETVDGGDGTSVSVTVSAVEKLERLEDGTELRISGSDVVVSSEQTKVG